MSDDTTSPTQAHPSSSLREVVLVTGISGSGKSVALHALEDAGFFCVDNLPPELLREFLRVERERSERRVAIAVDARSGGLLWRYKRPVPEDI
ncbi:MAG TPA: RNase adapter RapZ, partial [Albitalea sp.]|nr:RNase adapter RapZ [Albitalea sp.]